MTMEIATGTKSYRGHVLYVGRLLQKQPIQIESINDGNKLMCMKIVYTVSKIVLLNNDSTVSDNNI